MESDSRRRRLQTWLPDGTCEAPGADIAAVSPLGAMAVARRVLLCCVLFTPCRSHTFRGTPEGAGQLGAERVVTGTRGERASFSVGPFQAYCQWAFLGTETNGNGKDVIFSDGRMCPDQVFDQYRDRVEPSCNGSFFLKNTLFEDAGVYRSECDGQVTGSYYLHVVDPVCSVSIARIPSENGLLLYCNSTGSGASVAWTRDGRNVSESHILSDNHKLRVPRRVACGRYQCSVWCGVLGPQYATISLTSPDYSSLICCPLMTEILAVGGVYAVAFLVQAIIVIRRKLRKARNVCDDHTEEQHKPIHSETSRMTWRAICSTAVQIALTFWHWVIVFISIVCFLVQVFPRDWKSIDLTPFGILLAITLFVEVLLFIINRTSFFTVKVIPWVNSLLQHCFIIVGATYFLQDCLNMQCMHASSMSWACAVPIVVVPFLVLLVGAILYELCTINKLKQLSLGSAMNEVDSTEPCLEEALSPTERVNMEDREDVLGPLGNDK